MNLSNVLQMDITPVQVLISFGLAFALAFRQSLGFHRASSLG